MKEDSRYFIDKIQGTDTDSLLPVDKPDSSETQQYASVTVQEHSIAGNADAILIAAFGYALGKASCRTDAVFLTSSLQPVHVSWNEEESVSSFISSVASTLEEDSRHSDFSFDEIEKETGLRPDIIFGEGPECAYKLSLSVKDDCAVLRYRTSLYNEGSMRRFLRLFISVVAGLGKCRTLSQIALQSEEDRILVESFNDTQTPLPSSQTIAELFSESAKRNGSRIAVVCENRRLSYSELDSVSDRIASRLYRDGIGKGDFVSIMMNRSEWMPAAALGVIKSGAAYQPLDPSYPEERLSFMVEDSGARALICDRELLHLLPSYSGDILFTDEFGSLDEGPLPPPPSPSDPFILLYTSGTTGKPKGAMLSERNIVNYCLSYMRLVSLDSDSRVAAYASFGFDANMMDTYPTLLSGAELHILAEEIRPDLFALDRYFAVNEISHAFMTTQVGRQFALFTSARSLKYLSVGGEKLTPLSPPEGLSFYNLYGPTECTVAVTAYRVLSDSLRLPIGRPLGNVKLYVVDSAMRQLPVGEAGELCISGLQVGLGYWKREDKTKEVFIPNPFCDEKGYETLYRTGDIVRWLEDGNMEFIGRRDSQVKIRGFRIELSEVEKVIREYPGITDATVAAFDNPAGGKYVAAYVVSPQKVDIEKLNAFIAERKPDYMVPEVTMQIDAIPLTTNQKVNRRALPVPQRKSSSGYIPPRNDREEKISAFVSMLLGGEKISVTDSLDRAGLTSIGIIQLTAFMKREFDAALQISDLAANDTIERLASFVSLQKPLMERKKEVFYPISSSQKGIFAECLSSPSSTLYNIPFVFKLSERVDTSRLKKALIRAVNAHPYLKTILTVNQEGEVRAVRRDEARVSIGEESCQSLPGEDKLVQRFPLTEKELYRIALFHTSDGNYLFMDIHHIIFDGTSFVILLEDIEKAYRGERIEEETYTAFEYALDEEEAVKGEKYTEAKKHFDAIFSSLENTDSLPPSDTLKGAPSAPRNTVFTSSVSPERMKEWIEKHSVSAGAVFNTAFGYTLSLFSGTKDAVYATVYSGRSDPRLERAVSMFVKTFPMYFSVSSGSTVEETVRAVGKQYLDAMAHDVYPYSEMVRDYSLPSSVLFSYQGSQFAFDSIAGEKAQVKSLERDTEKAKAVVLVSEENGKYVYTFSSSSALYTEAFTLSFLRSLDRVLSLLLEKESFSEIDPCSEEDRARIDSFNRTEKEYDRKETVVSMISHQAALRPEKTAVVFRDVKISYCELDDLSSRIASFLRSNGTGRGSVVPILLKRSEWMPISALGVLRSGACYQPLDPSYPAERLSFMIEDSGAQLIIAERSLMSLIPGYRGKVLYTDEIRKLETGEVPPFPSVEDTFILLYTSGTTGQPKGAMLSHSNILNYVHWYCDTMALSSSSRVAAYASFGFDANMMDTYPTLVSGAELHILPDEIRMDLELIDEYFSRMGITHAFMTTQVGRQFALYTKSKSLKYLSVGGEKLTPLSPPEGLNFYNIYGPTECTVAVTNYRVTDDSSLLPIGRAMYNTKLYVVDPSMHVLPPGAVGELCIAGLQVGKGYLNRPDKSAESFVPNPFTQEEGYRILYRTGDIVRYLPSGNIDFVGRRDGQVKVRGFRIELTEIEKVIREYAPVSDATVAAFDSPSGGKFVAAYIVSDEKVDVDSLNCFIASKLPPYMVPSVTMQIDRIPLTVNQKVDRRALPKPEFSRAGYTAPEGSAEEDFCSVFQSVLGVESVGRDDDFFLLGGSSISAMKVVVEAGKKGYKIAYKDIFDNPTPHLLSSLLGFEEKKDESRKMERKSRTSDDEGFDYSLINSLLGKNTVDAFRNGRRNVTGDVLLLGCTGYLGIHMLRSLVKDVKRTVWAPVRAKDGVSGEERLSSLLSDYCMDELIPLVGKRIIILDNDVLLPGGLDSFRREGLTVFNCLACVKHFSRDDEIERINVKSVENLIKWCLENRALLVHVSTESTAGYSDTSADEGSFVFTEKDLYNGQITENNQYVRSKFLAERAVYTAVIEKGLRAKVMRVGNLSPRFSDGVFQVNYSTNGFMKMLRAYLELGELPYSAADTKVDFSPVDSTAESILLLASTPDECITFMPSNQHLRHLADILEEMDESIRLVEDEQFTRDLSSALSDDRRSETVSPLMTYSSGRGEESLRENGIETVDNALTLQILYRLGFRWPVTGSSYVRAFTEKLRKKGFFR